MVNRTSRLSKNLTDLFGSTGSDECRVCKNPLGNPRRKYCCDRCQRVAYATLRLYEWNRVRRYVLARDGYACTMPDCDASDDDPDVTLHVDHITPLADDGPAHDPENLQTLCAACNMSKGADPSDYHDIECPNCGHVFDHDAVTTDGPDDIERPEDAFHAALDRECPTDTDTETTYD